MLVTFKNLNLRRISLPKIRLRDLDVRKTAISGSVGLVGLIIVGLSLSGSTVLLDMVDSQNEESYWKILQLALGIFTIGLAMIIFSIHLMKKIIWGALGALLLVSFGLGCFALGTFFKCFLIALLAFMAVLWEIGKFDLEY